jgi:DNA polymerase III subunit alpha
VIESLIKSGSFDSLGARRSQLMAILEKAMDQAKAVQRDKQSGQMSLFAVTPKVEKSEVTEIVMPDIPEWDEHKRLALEKETVGFYITGHPLDDALGEIRTVTDSDIHNLAEWGEEQPVRIGGLIRTCKRLKSKKGEPMAFLALEDILETVEVVVFPETYARCEGHLTSTDPVIVQGTVQKDERGPKIIADSIYPLQEAREKFTEQVRIRLEADKTSRARLETLKKVLYQFHGDCPLLITMYFAGLGEVDIEVMKELSVRPCRDLSDATEKIFGYQPLSFAKKPLEAAARKKWNRQNGARGGA